jgi:GAF domain-containing protein
LNAASPTAQSYSDLKTEVERLGGVLAESVEQQTATSEILRVISQFPTDVQPVFDTILARAVRLCEGRSGALYRINDGVISVLASSNPDDEARRMHDAAYPTSFADLEPPVQRIAEGVAIHWPDVDAEPGLSDARRERARILGYRSAAVVPMVRDGRVLGSISVVRAGPGRSPKPFSSREIGLLEVFADQAVIAIENVRLFQELQSRNAQ